MSKDRILIADDHQSTLDHLSDVLCDWGYEVISVADGHKAWEILQGEDAPRIVLLDRRMPGIDGLEIVRRVREQAQEPYIYILLLTVYDQEKHLVAGLNAGADDYIVKPFRAHELQARIEAGRRILEIQEELILTRDQLHSQATTDEVTGLWNRSAILEILERELSRSKRSGTAVGLVMIDLDNFKQINDSYGHPAGDTVLLECGQRMRNCVRTYDASGRYGGDEFLSIHPRCNLDDSVMLGERLRREIARQHVMLGEVPLWVTASAGVVCSDGHGDLTAEDLIALADQALYEAKRAGRNRLEIAQPTKLPAVG
jgi:diguanylate cyclase (GGDEF)-like protein